VRGGPLRAFLKVDVLMRRGSARRGRNIGVAWRKPRLDVLPSAGPLSGDRGHHRIPTRTYSALPGRAAATARQMSRAVRWFCSAVLVSSATTAGSPTLSWLSPDVVLILGVAGVGGGQRLGDAG
jgi:hypothetical protein